MAGFSEILKHARNYLGANLATKALVFISIPILTRLLNPDEFGLINIYLGIVGILGGIMTLNADRSLSRYYFDQYDKKDYNQFVGTSILFSAIVFIINSLVIYFFSVRIGDILGIDENVVYLAIPLTLINVIGLTFDQIYGPIKKSKKIALSSLVRVYLGFSFSILLILLFDSEKFYGYILGQILAGGLMIIYWVKMIKPHYKFSFSFKHIKYIINFSIPLIPYTLSSVIIAQFSKIAIGRYVGLSQVGYFSLALAISGLVQIIIVVTHQAWNPYFYEYMNVKNYSQIDKDFNKIFSLTIFSALVISTFGEEIGFLLAKSNFTSSLYLIPLLTLGYIFYQFSYTFLRNFAYSKKTYFSSITVVLSGLLNVALNMVLIDKYGEIGAAIAFVASYFFMVVIAWGLNVLFIQLHTTPIKEMIITLIKIIPFYILLYFSMNISSMVILFLCKISLLLLFSTILLWKDRIEFISYINSFIVRFK